MKKKALINFCFLLVTISLAVNHLFAETKTVRELPSKEEKSFYWTVSALLQADYAFNMDSFTKRVAYDGAGLSGALGAGGKWFLSPQFFFDFTLQYKIYNNFTPSIRGGTYYSVSNYLGAPLTVNWVFLKKPDVDWFVGLGSGFYFYLGGFQWALIDQQFLNRGAGDAQTVWVGYTEFPGFSRFYIPFLLPFGFQFRNQGRRTWVLEAQLEILWPIIIERSNDNSLGIGFGIQAVFLL